MSYRDEVLRTANTEVLGLKDLLVNGAMGLCGEAGEVSELVKKHLFHGAALDREKLIKELGDVRWYMELLCHSIGVTLEQIEEENVKKLQLRYPNGFSFKDAQAKKDVKP